MKYVKFILILFISLGLFAKDLFMGFGESTSPEPSVALREAYNMLPNDVKEPDFCVIFLTENYNLKEILNEANKLMPNTKLYGETSCLGIGTPNGFIITKNGSLGILAFKSKRITFGVGISKNPDGFLAGKEVITNAIKNAGKTLNDKPNLVLISPTPGKEEYILKGIESVIGKDVPIFGGTAGDNAIAGKWNVFVNDDFTNSGVAVAVIYTDLKIGYAYISGYQTMEKFGVVTGAKERTIFTINNKPAGQVYNDWCDGIFSKEMNSGASILGPASFYPLARKVIEEKGVQYITLHPSRINPNDKSLEVFAKVNVRDTIYLLKGDKSILLSRPVSVAMKAFYEGGLTAENLRGGIFIYCAGTMLAVKDELGALGFPPLIKALNSKPFLTAFTFGEQGFYKKLGNFHGNLMCSIVLFGE